MAEKRRDNKGRLLLSGERQRSDGMYEYRYKDKRGVKNSVYSWRLVATDKTPQGKKCTEPLRDMRRRIEKDLEDEIDPIAAQRITLNDFYDDYIETKYELKPSTRQNYKYMYTKYVRDVIGFRKISTIKYSDIKKFYIHLINEIGFKPNSMEIIHTILHPVFNTAVKDGIIRLNPCSGVMAEIKKSHNWEKGKRHALTIPQQEAFVNFLRNSKFKQWLPLFTVFLGTGGRVGEILGLRWEDCDFENNLISINHNLIYRKAESGRCAFQVTTPKTSAGTRIVPMISDVKRALLEVYNCQMATGFNQTVVNGYSGFIFMNRFGDVLSAHNVNRAIERIYKAYNEQEKKNAREDHREAILLPHFSVHNLRHTFCTRFCENETNLKVIQEIMGHADIETTMNIYNEATLDKKVKSFANLEGKIKIS